MRRDEVEAQIAQFIDKYTPAMAAQLREARARLRARFPRGFGLPSEQNTPAPMSADGRRENASRLAKFPHEVRSRTEALLPQT